MESVAAWPSSRTVSTYRLHFAELARRRLPRWVADRIWVGNAIDWLPPPACAFDYVHILLDSAPRARRAGLIRHHLDRTVRPGTGRLLVSDYAADRAAGHLDAAETLSSLGFRCAGQTSGSDLPGRPQARTA